MKKELSFFENLLDIAVDHLSAIPIPRVKQIFGIFTIFVGCIGLWVGLRGIWNLINVNDKAFSFEWLITTLKLTLFSYLLARICRHWEKRNLDEQEAQKNN